MYYQQFEDGTVEKLKFLFRSEWESLRMRMLGYRYDFRKQEWIRDCPPIISVLGMNRLESAIKPVLDNVPLSWYEKDAADAEIEQWSDMLTRFFSKCELYGMSLDDAPIWKQEILTLVTAAYNRAKDGRGLGLIGKTMRIENIQKMETRDTSPSGHGSMNPVRNWFGRKAR